MGKHTLKMTMKELLGIYFLSTEETCAALPRLFAILYDNMNPIAPVDEPFEEARTGWTKVITQALQDSRRTMLVVRDGAEIVGFFMYAINPETGLFLMEEIQLDARYHGTGIFHRIYREVLPCIPDTVTKVQAYAHKNNLRSQGILSHLGLSVVGENKNGNSYRFCGKMMDLKKRFGF